MWDIVVTGEGTGISISLEDNYGETRQTDPNYLYP
jgi:hypothetical protein